MRSDRDLEDMVDRWKGDYHIIEHAGLYVMNIGALENRIYDACRKGNDSSEYNNRLKQLLRELDIVKLKCMKYKRDDLNYQIKQLEGIYNETDRSSEEREAVC